MKVKITKTIDMANLPGETRRMLDQVKNELMYGLPDQMSSIVRASLSSQGQEFFQTIDLIDQFRQNLAAFDDNLQEIQNVLTGYKNAVMPEPPQPTEQEIDQAAAEQAQYEKRMARTADVEEGLDEEG
jgi:hypothetical protein